MMEASKKTLRAEGHPEDPSSPPLRAATRKGPILECHISRRIGSQARLALWPTAGPRAGLAARHRARARGK